MLRFVFTIPSPSTYNYYILNATLLFLWLDIEHIYIKLIVMRKFIISLLLLFVTIKNVYNYYNLRFFSSVFHRSLQFSVTETLVREVLRLTSPTDYETLIKWKTLLWRSSVFTRFFIIHSLWLSIFWNYWNFSFMILVYICENWKMYIEYV